MPSRRPRTRCALQAAAPAWPSLFPPRRLVCGVGGFGGQGPAVAGSGQKGEVGIGRAPRRLLLSPFQLVCGEAPGVGKSKRLGAPPPEVPSLGSI